MGIGAVRLLIVVLVIVGMFTVLTISFFKPLEGFEVDIIDMLMGAMITAFAGIIGFYFRSQ